MKKLTIAFIIFSFFLVNIASAENSSSECFNFTKNITYRSTGNDVKDLQVFLKDKGFFEL